MKVIVSSKNPAKIRTTIEGFKAVFPNTDFDFEGAPVDSGVRAQPITDEETLKGANNRANNAAKLMPDADFWVGIEGGIEERDGELGVFAWVVIKSKEGKVGKGRTGTFFLPQKISDLINQGYELGQAVEMATGHINSKEKSGAVGLLTDNLIDRSKNQWYAVVFALIPFKHPELF